jgi:hypothetical protein
MRWTLIGLALWFAGCKSGDGLVVVTVTALDSAPVRGIASLNGIATIGGQTKNFTVPTGAPFDLPPPRTFGIDVPSSLHGAFNLRLEARDAAGTLLAAADGVASVSAGSRADIMIQLGANGPGPDDMAMPVDMTGSGGGGGGGGGGASPDMAYAPGFTSMTTSDSTSSEFRSVWGTSPSNVYAITTFGGLYRHTSGTVFTFLQTVGGAGVNTYHMDGKGPNDIYIAGINTAGTLALRNTDGAGTTWTNIATSTNWQPFSVWAFDATHIFLAGQSANVAHVEMSPGAGVAFANVTIPGVVSGSGLYTVWGASATDYWAVGVAGFLLHYTTANGWQQITTPPPAQTLWGMGGSSTSDVWIGGASGYLAHWNGTTLTKIGLPAAFNMFYIVSIWANGPNDVYAAGNNSMTGATSGIAHWDGASWSFQPQPLGTGTSFYAVYGTGPNDVYAVGSGGLILHHP